MPVLNVNFYYSAVHEWRPHDIRAQPFLICKQIVAVVESNAGSTILASSIFLTINVHVSRLIDNFLYAAQLYMLHHIGSVLVCSANRSMSWDLFVKANTCVMCSIIVVRYICAVWVLFVWKVKRILGVMRYSYVFRFAMLTRVACYNWISLCRVLGSVLKYLTRSAFRILDNNRAYVMRIWLSIILHIIFYSYGLKASASHLPLRYRYVPFHPLGFA